MDWKKVADATTGHNPEDCKHRWQTYLGPHVDTSSPWSKDEDDWIWEAGSKFYAKDHDYLMWTEIAKQTRHRAPYQCLMRYHALRKPKEPRKAWSAKEDEILMNIVRKFGSKNWAQVSLHLEGKAGLVLK